MFNSFFYICDNYGYLQHRKIPRLAPQIASPALLRDTLFSAIVGNALFALPVLYYVIYPVFPYCNCTLDRPLPSTLVRGVVWVRVRACACA